MKRVRRLIAAFCAVLPVTVLVSVTHANATSPDLQPAYQYMMATYDKTTHPFAAWFAAPSLVTAGPDWVERAFNASTAWDALEGGFTFEYSGTSGSTKAQEDGNYGAGCFYDYEHNPVNEIQVGLIPGASSDVGGATHECVDLSRHLVYNFTIRMQPRSDWYTGTGSDGAIPSTEYDLWSAITHELGHALGWAGTHYQACSSGQWANQVTCSVPVGAEPTSICGGLSQAPDRGTMCSQGLNGSAIGRNPSSDDRVVFYTFYPKQPVPGGGGPDICNPFGLATSGASSTSESASTPIIC